MFVFFFSSRRRHTRWPRDWSSDVCSSDLEDVFRAAVRDFVARHAYAAADWRELLDVFAERSGRNLKEWGAAWVVRRGLPIVRLAWDTDDAGRMRNAGISQRDALSEGGVWP